MALQSGARFATAEQLRQEARAARWKDTTSGQAPGFAQANLVVLPAEHAFEFTRFCLVNPKPCPLMEVLDVGDPVPRMTAPAADLRTDVPGYRIYRGGELDDEVDDVMLEWKEDAVAFLLGCSFTFEEALLQAGISLRHQELGCTVPMYRTTMRTRPCGIFQGRMVVSMRPIPAGMVSRAVRVTARFPMAHGAPIHVGDPSALGIEDLGRPDYGDPVPLAAGELPMFWGCGVTPQSVSLEAKPDWMITHSPGRMFVTDVRNDELDVLQGEFPG